GETGEGFGCEGGRLLRGRGKMRRLTEISLTGDPSSSVQQESSSSRPLAAPVLAIDCSFEFDSNRAARCPILTGQCRNVGEYGAAAQKTTAANHGDASRR